MSVDVVLYTFGFHGGGAERVMIQLANHWAQAGARIAFVTNVPDGPLRSELSADIIVRTLNARRMLPSMPALARALRDFAPGAVVSAMFAQNITACAARRLSRRDFSLLVVSHSYLSHEMAQHPGWKRRILKRMARATYPLADAIATVSTSAARDMERFLGVEAHSVRTLHNPIWPHEPTPEAEPGDVHRWLAGPHPVLLTAGRLSEEKNHANLLRAFAIAREARPMKLVLLGDGPLRDELECLSRSLGIDADVDLPGFRRDVADFMRFSDLFVLSSNTEGLPLSLMEAMKFGTPVVATDCLSGPRELLADGRYGRLVPVGDPAALASAILEALEDPGDAEALKARAAEFDIEEVARRYEEVMFPNAPPPWRRREA